MADLPREPPSTSTPAITSRGRLLVEWSALLFAGTLLVTGLLLSGATTRLDNAIYDFALRFRHRPPPAEIVIVAIDFPSIARQGPWPWSRDVLANMVRNLARGEPKALVLDLLFQSKGPPAADAALAAAVAQAPVYVPEILDERGQGRAGHITRPIPAIAAAARGVGRSNPTADLDGIVRRTLLTTRRRGQSVPELMLVVADQTAGVDGPSGQRPPRSPGARARDDEILIPFAGPPGHFEQIAAADAVRGAIPPDRLRGRYVLVGATAPGLLDNYPTPMSGAAGMPNVEIDANILDAILHHRLVRELSSTAKLALSVALIWLSFLELLWSKPTHIALQPVVSLGIAIGCVAALALSGVWFPPMPVLIGRTVVQSIWSSRRLKAASDYFARELAELQARTGVVVPPSRAARGVGMGDSVSRQMILIEETKRRVGELRRFITDVLANFPDPVLVVSPRGRIVIFNQAATDLGRRLGRATEIGSPIQPLLRDLEAAAGHQAPLWPPVITPGAPARRGVAPGGRIVEVRYTPTGHDDGVPKGWTVHLVDVTALVSAMRQREEAMQLFTHDLRAPQSAILAALQQEEFKSVPQAIRDRIERNAVRTLGLVENFVRLAQAEGAEYDFEPIDFFHLLADAVDALWSIARAASVEIAVEEPGREFVVDADRSLMARALINLLDNAVKFSPPGARVLCTLSEATLRGGPAVACSIADQACGMTQEQQKSLFKHVAPPPPVDDDEAAPPLAVGVGLGLAMVRTVATRHDGVIDCRSEMGVGTVFTITLPLLVEDEPTRDPEDDELEPPPLPGERRDARAAAKAQGPTRLAAR